MSKKNKRAFLFVAQGGRCSYCGIKMTMKPDQPHSCTIDHIIPLSMGGPKTIWNLIGACSDCNSRKADKPLVLFLAERALTTLVKPPKPKELKKLTPMPA